MKSLLIEFFTIGQLRFAHRTLLVLASIANFSSPTLQKRVKVSAEIRFPS
jgi:hypothetical protein